MNTTSLAPQREDSVQRQPAAMHSPPLLREIAWGRSAYDTATLARLAWMASPTGMAVFEEDGVLVYINAAFRACFPSVAVGRAQWQGFLQQFSGASDTTGTPAGPVVADWLHAASGRWFAVGCSQANLRGRRLRVLDFRDVTQRMAEEQRRRSQHQELMFTSKVMSVGEMAATLAHELNQPIGSVLNFLNGCLQRLDRGVGKPADLREPLVEARQQCERAAAIITRIREFVRAREPRFVALPLGEVFTKVTGLLDAEIKTHRIEVALEIEPDLPPVSADAVMIEQVVHNLVKNAIDAMRQQSTRRHLLLQARRTNERTVQASVRDSGPGVPQAARDQLFSPFFTTKPDGLGIGLNICRSMVEFHGGSLLYDRPPEGGSLFSFTLPASAPGATGADS
jgi:signal transduction histidine kinase